jgi:hypothetical protein
VPHKIRGLHARVLTAARATVREDRKQALRTFAVNLERAFYAFEPDFFQQHVTPMVDDVISVIKGSVELWPTLVEIMYFHKDGKDLPHVRVKNKRKA